MLFLITRIGKERYYYVCTLLLYIEKKGSLASRYARLVKVRRVRLVESAPCVFG
jgi:hypothetical protein